MKITIAPDSFKGSLSASKATSIIKQAIKKVLPDTKLNLKPMADGGEGTLDTLLEVKAGKKIALNCKGPLGENITTYYGIIDGDTAVIEIAKICGLTTVPISKRNPELTTSYGVGEAINDAVNRGVSNIIIGLGGSATNDGGYGMLSALGVKGKDLDGNELTFYAKDLYKLNQLDWSHFNQRIKNITITVANDVNNPLCGRNGASFIYGKQKGATVNQIKKLDNALFNYAQEVTKYTENNHQYTEGVGAAGGLGFGLKVIGAKLEPGAELIAKILDLETSIASSDWIITGEGKSDQQTLYGKAPKFVSTLAKKYDKPIILISGSVDNSNKELTEAFTAIFSILNRPITTEEAMDQAKDLLYNQVIQIIKLIKLNEKN